MNWKYFYGTLAITVITSLVILIAAIGEATAVTVLDQQVIRIILVFDLQGVTTNQVENYFNTQVKPDLQTEVVTFMNTNFDPGWTIDERTKVIKNGDTFQIYPKMVVSGVSDSTPQELKQAFNQVLRDMRDIMTPHLESQGATDIWYHVTYSTGGVKELNP